MYGCQYLAAQVAVPEEGEAEGAGARMRHFQVKIKWASSVNITDIEQYMKCAACKACLVLFHPHRPRTWQSW